MKFFLLFLVSIIVLSCSKEPITGTTHVPNMIKGKCKKGSIVYLLSSKQALISNVLDSQITLNNEYSFKLKNNGDYYLYSKFKDSVSLNKILDYKSEDGMIVDANIFQKTIKTTFSTKDSQKKIFIEGVPSSLIKNGEKIDVLPTGQYNIYTSSIDTTGFFIKSQVETINILNDSIISVNLKADNNSITILDSTSQPIYQQYSWENNLCNMKPENILDLKYFIVDSAKNNNEKKEFNGASVRWDISNIKGISYYAKKGIGSGVVSELTATIDSNSFADFKIGDDNYVIKCGCKLNDNYYEKFINTDYDISKKFVTLTIQINLNKIYWIINGKIVFQVVSNYNISINPKISNYITTNDWATKLVGDSINIPDTLTVQNILIKGE